MNQQERSVLEDISGRLQAAILYAPETVQYRQGAARPGIQPVLRDCLEDILNLLPDDTESNDTPDTDE